MNSSLVWGFLGAFNRNHMMLDAELSIKRAEDSGWQSTVKGVSLWTEQIRSIA